MHTRTLLVVVAFTAATALAQEPTEKPTGVAELDALHVPISALWHEAWPAKDVARLKALLPEVEKRYATLAAVMLPGHLHEKQTAWNAKLPALAQSVKDYRAAADEGTTGALLKAAEEVHANFEAMVAVVRPPLPELDAFHKDMFLLHHHYIADQKAEQMQASAAALTKRMVALNAAVLPKRLEARSNEFTTARAALAEAVKAFAEGVQAGKGKDEIATLERAVHDRYEALEKILEP